MSVQNGERLATKQDLADMYQGILPYLGGMPEMVANKFSKGDLYSTDEKMIGQWIDGRPLYQKTIYFEALSNMSYVTKPHGVSDLGEVVFLTGIASNGVARNVIPFAHDQSVANQILLMVNGADIEIDNRGYDYSTFHAYVTLQYTKSTDSAISIGNDTDYSTEEKIVGTWVNGKPIYQRVVHFSPQQTSYQAYTAAFSTYFPDSVYTDIVAVSGFYNQTYYSNKLFDIEVQFDTNIIIKNASEKAMWTVDIIVCYTKTTD